jgi:hypothetical protein
VARNGAGGEAVQFVVQIRLDVFRPLPHAGQVELFLSRSAENTLKFVRKRQKTGTYKFSSPSGTLIVFTEYRPLPLDQRRMTPPERKRRRETGFGDMRSVMDSNPTAWTPG